MIRLENKGQPFVLDQDEEYLINIGGPLKTLGQFNTLYASGVWDGAEISLYASPDPENVVFPVTGAVLDDDGFFNFLVKSKGVIVKVEGSGSNTSINLWIE